ncbi:MAG: DUF4082 domain-containing protein, partial [Limisphaerales bacterium]
MSYHAPNGGYSYDFNYFASSGFENYPLRALSSGESGGNGVFVYGPSAFPANTWNAANYWVDVVFSSNIEPDTTPPLITMVNPASGTLGVSVSSLVSASFNEALDPVSITTNTVMLFNSSGNVVPATVSYDATNISATLKPNVLLTPGETYTAKVKGGVNGVTDSAGNSLNEDYVWTFTTSSQFIFSLWDSSVTPRIPSHQDFDAVELGLKFRSAIPGNITGIRFYKGSENTGTHIGRLWTADGTLLASVVFANETPSGWQSQLLTTPVPIAANTTYIVSYNAPQGRYAADVSYFASTGHENYPLQAPSSGQVGGNGVYRYGPSGSFPDQTFNAANYWVDVEFQSNTAPIVANTIPNQTATYGIPFNFTVAENSFIDPDGDLLQFSVSHAPPGISFDGSSRTFFGSPAQPGAFLVHVIAVDTGNPPLANTNSFTLTVEKAIVSAVEVKVADRTYDGTTHASIIGGSLDGVLGADDVRLATSGAQAAFSFKTAGTNKPVTVT